MTRFVRMYRYEPVSDPTARLRLDYDTDEGLAMLVSEDVLHEQADNPDTRHHGRIGKTTMTTDEVLWLAAQLTELAVIMARNDREAQAEVDARRQLDGIPQHEPAPAEEIDGIPEPVDAKFDDSEGSKR